MEQNKPTVKPVTTNPVTVVPANTSKSSAFMADLKSSAKTAGKYVWKNIVIPYAKRIVIDSTNNAVSIVLGDKPGSVSNTKNKVILSNGTIYTDYTKSSQSQSRSALIVNEPQVQDRKITRYENYVFETYSDAQVVLQELANYIDTYGAASIAMYCELCGETNKSFNDETYGWDNLSSAQIYAVPDGYKIKFPKFIKIV